MLPWLEFFLKLLPWFIVLAGLIGAAIELRMRKLVDAKFDIALKIASDARERLKEDLRREFQVPIGEVGVDAFKALEKVQVLEKQLAEQGVKIDFYWRAIETSAADMLRHKDG